ncbi:hypothetical protein F4780DRAFT_751617 [Xylariomycetidae sp. FL0641]|nr:hypothetical protein F4780DRAFT_751617 [Xylariomycetidae sp. FL0641]
MPAFVTSDRVQRNTRPSMANPQGEGASPAPSNAPRAPRGRGSRTSRGRGGRSGRPRVPQASAGTTGPAPAPGGNEPPPRPPSSSTQAASGAHPGVNADTPSNRGRRRPRASGRRGATSDRTRTGTTMGAHRTFGGHLTSEAVDGGNSVGPTELNGSAQAFVPGQPAATSASAVNGIRDMPKPPRRKSKSTAPDLPTRIHEDISNAQYECVICTNEVLPNSKVWSCSKCWTVTHMSCVRKWYSNRTKPSNDPESWQTHQAWRCPGCNSAMHDEPSTYHCWCGKEINPSSTAGLSPHSCGQTCSKPRGTCPHPCPLQCHAGPCPPCLLMGPSQPCFCGKQTSTKRCGETNYGEGWSCHQECGDLLACGEHPCLRECHPGLCGDCEVPVYARCYCGRTAKEVLCEARGDQIESYNYGQAANPGDWFVGSFKCEQTCGRAFDCEKHFCQHECHPQHEQLAHCPFSTDAVSHCPCGKTALVDIAQPRKDCEDPIPNCDKVCNKSLSCGHSCQQVCHSGPCAPCTQRMEVSCRCGRTKTTGMCHQGDIQHPWCRRVCRAQLNCGRHEHGEHCCPAERSAIERVAAKRKNKISNVSTEEFEAEHICTRSCGRDLKCGQHRCQQLCHRGACNSCPEAIFDEISCHCGRTVLQPPQPCGTKPPECRFDCTRPRPCGHPQVPHTCHTDDKACPNCPFLVEKLCICGKKTLKNQPCWFEQSRCGLPCARKLKCGTHTCGKQCHAPGECEDANTVGSRCKQPCGKTRTCGHLDIEQCHAPYPCKEDKPCQAKTFVTCDCQHKKQEINCMATKANPSPQRQGLKCDDECLRLKRNARLANALNIDPKTHTDDHVPYSDTTLKYYRENPQWAETYEREFRVFAGDPEEKRLRFKPMKPYQRAFLHSLAEDFGLDSASSDPEPHRHVCLFKTPRFVSAPMKTLAQALKLHRGQSALPENSASADNTALPVEPYNAFVLSAPRFGLTIEEIDAALKKHYATYPTVKFHTSFLPSEEVVIKGSGSWAPQTLENSLTAFKPTLTETVRRLDLAKDVVLARVDDELNVLRREAIARSQGEGGWNAVVGRSAARPRPAPATTPTTTQSRSKFVILKKEPKKKTQEGPVDENWEAAADKLQEDGDHAK